MVTAASAGWYVAPARAQEVTYQVTFQGNWTTASTPGGVVAGAHFTTLIGAVHGSGVTFWESGGTASPGVENVAELGSTGTFRGEVQASPHTRSVIQQGVSGGGTASATFTITVTRTYPLVTLLSMIGPSPDWFVGVSGLSLLDSSNQWRQNYQVNLFPYDAGTEDGTEFTLSNLATDPQGVITSIRGTGKFSNVRMARLTFTNQTPDPEPVASFASSASSAGEGSGTRNVTVNLEPAPQSGITLNYGVGGTATSGTDYATLSGSVSVSSGASSVDIPVTITDDNADESDETVVLALTGSTGYSVGSANRHTLTIRDNDGTPPLETPVASFASSASSAGEGAGTRNVTVNLEPAPQSGITLNYGVGGTATSGSDYATLSGSVSASSVASSVDIPVAITDDNADENNETVVLTLTAGSGYTVGSPNRHTLTINDDDGGGGGGTPPKNQPPTVILSCAPCSVMPAGEVSLTATATDQDNDPLTYAWSAPRGSFAGSTGETTARWTAPEETGPVAIRVEASDDAGGTAAVELTVDVALVLPEEAAFEIPNQGIVAFFSSGEAESLRTGYGRIRADGGSGTPSGIAMLEFRGSEGVLITEVGVRASALVSRGRIFAEVHGPVDTAIAFANPHTTRADIGFYLTDGNGSRIAEGTFSLEAHQQMATFLSAAPFNVESVVGAFTFTASAPLAVVALRELTNQVGEWLLTTLPVTPTRPPPSPFSRTPTAPVLFPHFADGLGWSTQVILVNPTAQPIAGTVEFLGPDAAPAVLTLSDGRRGSRFDYEIPAESARRFATSNTAGPLSSGWVRATPSRSASPSGLLVFSFSSADKTISEVGVPALGASSAFRVPVDALGAPNRPGSIRTGLAIANTTDEESTVTLEITRPDGSLVRPIATLTLPPLGQSARMLDKIVDVPDDFTSGLLRVSATGEVAVTALRIRINERGELKVAATAPSNEIAPATSDDRFFARLADSDGWTTELILFSGTVGEASSGTLGLFWFSVP